MGQVEAATPGPVPTAVAAPTVSLSSDAAMASQVTYTVGFTTSAQGGLAANQGSITLVAPEGTVFPLVPGDYSVTAGATKVSSLICGNPSIAGGRSVVSVTVSTAVGAGQALTLAVTGVTNPATGPSALTVETSSDTQAVSTPSYRLVAATAVAAPTVSLSSDAAMASQVTYTVGFTTSAQGGLAANQGSITLVAPEGTVFPLVPGDYSVTAGATKVSSLIYGNPSIAGGGSVVSVTVSTAVGAGQALTLAVTGVTNPATGPSALTVETSSDTQAVSTPSYRLVAATAVAAPTVSLSSDAAMASQVTYTVGFTTSAQGGLAANQGSITLVAPEGTVFPLVPGDYSVTAGATKVSSLIYGNPSIAGGGSVVSVTVSTAVGAGQALTLAVTGVTNPATGPSALTVETSSDTQAVSTPSYRLVAATAVAAPTVSLSSDAAMASQVTYTVGFTTSAQGGLAANQGNITLVAPEGTVFPLVPGDYSVTAGATKVSSLIYGNPSIAGGGSVVSVTVSTAVGAGQALTLAVTGVTNPATGPSALTVETSSDTQAVSTPSYRLVAATAVAAPTVSLSSRRALASGVTWKVDFTTGARGALSATHGVIMLAAPAGTVLSPRASDYFVSTGGTAGAEAYNVQLLGDGSIADVTAPSGIPANSSISVVASSVTNPPAGSLSLDVSTSSQPVRASSTIRLVGTAAQLSATTQFSARLSDTEGGAGLVTYTLHLRTSAHGALKALATGGPAQGVIIITGPAGTRFDPCTSGCAQADYVIDGQSVASAVLSGDLSTVALPVPADIGARQLVTVTLYDVTNTTTLGPTHMSVWTTADVAAVDEVQGDRPERGKASFGEPLQHDQGSGLGGLHAEVPHRTGGRASRFRY